MQTGLENRKGGVELTRDEAAPPHVGTPHVKSIGPHQHGWEFYAKTADGGTYEVCQLCGTRRVNLPLVTALHRDWIEGEADWEPSEEESQPVVAVAIPTAYQAAAAAEDGDDGDDAKPARRGRPPKPRD